VASQTAESSTASSAPSAASIRRISFFIAFQPSGVIDDAMPEYELCRRVYAYRKPLSETG
jgi:hypothetical protein